MENYRTNSAEVMSINYDFIPTSHQAKKSLWLELKTASCAGSLRFGSTIKMHSLDPYLKLPCQEFQVLDVIGNRVIIEEFIPSYINPKYTDIIPFQPKNQKIGQWTLPTHWGYSLKDKINSGYRSSSFGSGVSVAYITW